MEHGPVFYLIPWALALTLSVGAICAAIRIVRLDRQIVRLETGRDQSFPLYYRLGGVILSGIYLVLLMMDGRFEHDARFTAFLIGLLAIIFFSVADDLGHVTWPWHLSFQILLGILVFSSGARFDIGPYLGLFSIDGWMIPSLSFFAIIVWVILIMNALNWVDGTDGAMPGIAAISFGTVFVLALQPEVNQPTIALMAATLLGLSLGLLFFNWYPARILAGTGGAYFFGFALSILALYAGMKVATVLVVLSLPILDALFVLARRIMERRSPFLPDRAHFHHLLLASGWHPAVVAATFLGLTAFLGFLALILQDTEKIFAFAFFGAAFAAVSFALHISIRIRRKPSL
ncbi:MAG: undecaprenyl/decaprenyl-phosphate alpha-N-acetylglucosaminyl 1-phosphate transferase [Candidatus Moraniibacteriota bacterium]|nr:MAG: undecaprenyl/decaprenyl-phosphate alpha-N-acetylglucosaminyl 1-phosphate transferase [Candidatus Moranbacteria bacterium]